MSRQTTDRVVLIRPQSFGYNPETAVSNAFQQEMGLTSSEISEKVEHEFDGFVYKLKDAGVDVLVVEDTAYPAKADAVFPNNWFTTHTDGTMILYPMLSANRRLERRPDIVKLLEKEFEVKRIVDLSDYEKKGKFLEGTGCIVFDHPNRTAYASQSERTHPEVLDRVCQELGYQPITFDASDENGKPIYHTNVMMSIGTSFVICCMESIPEGAAKQNLLATFAAHGRDVLDISYRQMRRFAGNMLELTTTNGQTILVMSLSAHDVLNSAQREKLSSHAKLLPMDIPTIETIGGGSARCMIAEVFFPRQ